MIVATFLADGESEEFIWQGGTAWIRIGGGPSSTFGGGTVQIRASQDGLDQLDLDNGAIDKSSFIRALIPAGSVVSFELTNSTSPNIEISMNPAPRAPEDD